jgi:hypothetical protein
MKTKVAIIGTVGLPAKYGGFETLTAHLVKSFPIRMILRYTVLQKNTARRENRKLERGKTEVSSFRRQRNPEYSLRYMVYFSCFIPK